MKKFIASLLLLGAGFCSYSQQYLSGQMYTGLLFPYNDFTLNDYQGYRPNLAVGAGLGYEIHDMVRLRGDLVYGNLNGNNGSWYYETTLIEPQLGTDLNLLQAIFPDFNLLKLNIQLGVGMTFYNSRLYDETTSELLVTSPVRSESAVSPNAFLSYGANLSLRLTNKLDLNVGMTNRYVDDADWMDGFKNGDYTDHYGLAQVGFVYYLKSDRTPATVEVKDQRYNELTKKESTLSQVEKELESTREKVARLEMEQQEKSLMIRSLKSQLDSSRKALATNVDTVSAPRAKAVSADAKSILGTPQYRIIVASLPSRDLADRWMENSNLPKDEMVIAYIDNLDTYRVVYRSYNTFEAARKEQQRIKQSIPDAWIVKF